MGKNTGLIIVGVVGIAAIIGWTQRCTWFKMCGGAEAAGSVNIPGVGQAAGKVELDDAAGKTPTTAAVPPIGDEVPESTITDEEMERKDKMGLLAPGQSRKNCCVCRWDGDIPRCNRKIGGPWTSYRTARKETDLAMRMERSLQICNKHCKTRTNVGGEIVYSGHASAYRGGVREYGLPINVRANRVISGV